LYLYAYRVYYTNCVVTQGVARAAFRQRKATRAGPPAGLPQQVDGAAGRLGAEGIEGVIRLVQDKARKDGNLHAAAILLDRMWPRGSWRTDSRPPQPALQSDFWQPHWPS
jgi:hypothetical protein